MRLAGDEQLPGRVTKLGTSLADMKVNNLNELERQCHYQTRGRWEQ